MEISKECRGEDQQFLFLIQESFLTQHVLEPSKEDNVCIRYSLFVNNI